jgi:gliding motility-associated-like protein
MVSKTSKSMVSPKSHPIARIFLLVALLFAVHEGRAQCNPPDQLPSIDCNGAPLICLDDACYETLNNPLNCCTGFCGAQTAVHNPEYFQFVPTCPDVEIHIHVDGCDSGNALQSALIGACPWTNADVITCDPGTPVGGTMVLAATGLVVGQVYYLLIDGSSGATCEYTIEFTDCILQPGLDGDITDGEANPTSVCQGYNGLALEVSPPVGNAHGYYWVLEWSGDTVTSTLPEHTIDVPANVPGGIYEICVRAFSGCDTSDFEVCFEVEVYEIPDEIKPPAIFCPEEFPFNWGSVNISGPDEYFQNFTTPEGCSFDSSWVVEEYPEVPVGFIDTLHCEETLIYEGMAYDDAGLYDLEYPGMGLNGCDSTAELEVTLAAIDAFIELTCENGEFVLSVLIQELLPTNADLEYEWYESGVLVSTDIQYQTLDGGVFICIVTVITPAGECSFPLEQFAFDPAVYRPDPPNMGFTDTLVCAQPGVIFEVIVDPFEDPLEYTWSGPANVPIFQDGSSVAEFDFSNSGPAEICVYGTNECGDGEPFCFMVDIQPTPVANFSFDPDVCADETMVVTFTGSASAIAEVIWDFDNPTTLVGSGIGPYTVSWAVPGNKVINLTVIEPGCDTAYNSAVVTVSTFQPPVVNCTSTISSVFFDWDDVAGSSGYLVSINGGVPVPTATSEWLEDPLPPGAVINLTLTVVSAGPCPDIVVMATCTAEDCPPPTIILSGQDSACLNAPTIIDLEALVNGLPGVGVWAGPGIIDADMGLFDPRIATAGQHQVTFTATVNGCPFIEPYLITVFDSLTADFTIDPVICIDDAAGLTFTGNASGTALFDYDFGAATVVTGSGPGPYQLSWASPGLKSVRLQVSENGCLSDIITQTSNVIATLNPPVINCSPNTSGILFSWSVDPAAANHVVNTLIGPVGNPVGTDSLEFTGLVPGDIVEIEIITISAGPCPDRRDTLQCVARQCPMPVIVIAPVTDICLYPGTSPIDLDVSVTNGAGSGTWAGPGITDPVNGIFDPVIAGAGSHQITFNYNDDGCDFIESITINVYDVPGAFISNTDLMITCLTGSIILDGAASSGGPLNYQWSTGNGVIFGSTTSPTAEARAQGVYQLRVTNAVSGCVDSTTVTVTQDANIPIADAGPDQTITCTDLTFTLGGNSTTGVNIVYGWTTPDGRIIGPTVGTTIQTDLNGEYNITVRDTSNGCQATDRALVGIDTAVATVTLTPGDTIDCNTPISTAQSTISNGIATDYAYTWTTTDGTIVGNANGESIQVSQGGTYTLTIVQNDNGCSYTEDVVVQESDEIIDAVDVSLTNVICNGDNNGTITVNSVMGGIAPYDYAWSGTPQIGSSLTDLGPGFYTLTVSDQNGCSYVEAFEVTEPARVTLDVGPDMTVRVMDSVVISIITNLSSGATGSIDWTSGNGSINCPGCPTIAFIASTSTTISSMIADTSGCTAEDSMRLTVITPKIYYIPNVFSPNGDNINDYFTVYGRFNLERIGYLRIFDRWGNQVFENTDFDDGVDTEGWDGKFNGEQMQPGVFAYVAELRYDDGYIETVTGEVTVIR